MKKTSLSFKSCLTVVIIFMIFGCVFISGINLASNHPASAEGSLLLKGDMDDNGIITPADARTVLRIAAGLENEQFVNIDNINGSTSTTEPSTVPTTEPSTVPITEPSTAPTTEPSTAPTTEPSTEEILAKYTDVMQQLKDNVDTYEKKEFQTLADDYDLGTIGNLVLPIAQGIMTSENEAEIQCRNDMEQIPIIRNNKGCLLTDVSKIKEATMVENGSKTTITIVLKDEKNPYPAEEGATSCNSAIGSMFNPLNQQEIDNIVAEFSGVATIRKFELTGKDCTATLTFDTATGKVEELVQVMNYFIEVDAKAVFVPVSGYATLTDKMIINNVEYK